MSLKIFGNPENEEGRWFPFTLTADGAEVSLELKVRRVPSGKEDELSFRHFGKKMSIKNGVRTFYPEKLLVFAIDKASFALLDSRGFPDLDAGDAEGATQLSEALGREVKQGETVPIDGHWTPDLKRLVLDARRDVLRFVNAKADRLAGYDAEEEDELGKT